MIFEIDRKPSDHMAVISEDGTLLTYGQLKEHIMTIGQQVESRCLIFCICQNCPQSLLGYLAFLERGAVPLLLSAQLKEDQLQRLIGEYHPSYIWRPETAEGTKYVLESTGYDPVPMHAQLSLLLTTSGSTGSPKLVRITRKNLESNADAIADYLSLDQTARPITVLPMHYTFGLSVMNSHLLAGGCILMTRSSVVQQEFWDFLARERATTMSGVPYTYEILKKIRFMRREGIDSLKQLTQAGGHLSPALQQEYGAWAGQHGIDFFVMYGQTEATARMSYLPPEHCLDKPGSIGIPVPGGRFRLLDDAGTEYDEPETAGELVYYGPNVTMGYASCREDLIRGDEWNGRLLTGDLACRDKDGYYYICGRKKRFIKIFGNRVNLDECEHLLEERFPYAVFACFGEDDHLMIVTTDAEVADAETFLAETLQLHEKAFSCAAVQEIPVKENGKTDYERLKEVYNNAGDGR